MGFTGYPDLRDSHDEGKVFRSHFRKAPSNTTIASWWFDLSMASGNPPPQYYAASPMESGVLDGMRGIFHGDDKSPSEQYLTDLMLVTPTAGFVGRYLLCDYLLFYPFVDGDDGDIQTMIEVETLPRYESGDGVMVMAVAVAPTVGSGAFTFTYINQDGVERTSPSQLCGTTAANIGSIVTSQPSSVAALGPFLTLADGDTGVRSIVSAQFSVLNGGLVTLVLVKPLADHTVREISTPSETQFLAGKYAPPRIYDGAYLSFIVQTAATVAAGTLTGSAAFAWN